MEKKRATLAWVGEHLEVLQLASKLQHKGFDVKSYLRDYRDGKVKGIKHYWGKTGGK